MRNFIPLKHKRVENFESAARLNKEWDDLCAIYLPLADEKSIWRYNRQACADSPKQGWKIHLSATILSAVDVLRSVAPFLSELQVQFKAPASLFELMKINTGIFYGYSQIGKFITVYPKTNEEFVFLAGALHRLTIRQAAPAVPFDFRFKRKGNVFYRFGAFRQTESGNADEPPTPFLIAPNGETIPDARESADLPDWVKNPFPPEKSKSPAKKNPLQTTYKVFRALSQRGKGGVYLAFYGNIAESRLCVLKEGRKNGETAWNGRDGFYRIKNEKLVLENLLRKQIAVPKVFDYFRLENNCYLVIEFIDGTNLRTLISREKLPLSEALNYGFQLAETLGQIHRAKWVWRDCKPENIIVSEKGSLRVLDFEGACRALSAEPLIWTTPDYTPPEAFGKSYRTANFAEDLYALGKILFLLFEGNLPEINSNSASSFKRRGVHPQIKQVVGELLDNIPSNRPSAKQTAQILKNFLN